MVDQIQIALSVTCRRFWKLVERTPEIIEVVDYEWTSDINLAGSAISGRSLRSHRASSIFPRDGGPGVT